MAELTFAAGRLTEGGVELARIEEPGPRIVAGDRVYEIVRTRERGRHYAVDAPDGERVCEFHQLPLRRGGTLGSPGTAVELRGGQLRRTAWRFRMGDGPQLDARVSAASQVVELRGDDALARLDDAPIVLALGCWLIVGWMGGASGGSIEPPRLHPDRGGPGASG